MNIEELNTAEKELNKEYVKKVNQLRIEFAKQTVNYHVGQVIDNGIFRILIDRIDYSVSRMYGEPCAVYRGVEITKKGKPKKNGSRASIYQSDKIKVIK